MYHIPPGNRALNGDKSELATNSKYLMVFFGIIRKANTSFLQNLYGTPGAGLRSNIKIFIISFFVVGFTSCVSTRGATYFNDLGDSAIPSDLPVPESLIQKNDILSISVSSLNPEATLLFNTPNNSVNSQSSGYLVAADGTIQFPILGSIKAEGLNKTQLKERLTQGILDKKLLLDPNITIRFLNFRVTILGEVSKPTVVTVPSEKISLLEALGLAGDMTVFAKRHNVMIIRENNNQKIIKRVNLNSTELFQSPYYYLQSNDVVYVEPNKSKVATASDSRQLLPIVLSGLSLFAIVIDRIVR